MSDGKRLVITGGIGSGKSSVSGFLAAAGWQILDADQVGHEVLTLPSLVEEVGRVWPFVVTEGVVDRAALGALVFADGSSLAQLEAIVHPLITERIESWLGSKDGLRGVEVSVLKMVVDRWGQVLVVDALVPARLQRVVARGLSTTQAEKRLAAQPDRQTWLRTADYVISNQGSLAELESATKALSDFLGQL